MPSIPGQARLGPTGRRNRTSLKPLYELLENRTLMSQSSVSSSASSFFSSLLGAATGTLSAQVPLVPVVISSELPKNVSGRIAALYELSLTQHPLYQSIKDGHVSKAPMFYSEYTGPKRWTWMSTGPFPESAHSRTSCSRARSWARSMPRSRRSSRS